MQESPEHGSTSRGAMEGTASFSPIGVDSRHLLSGTVNEAAEKRFQAATWIQSMVGPLHLSAEPSEDEFRLCLRNGMVLCNLINKIQPGAVPKIVGGPARASLTEGAGNTAFQHSQNLRHFLASVERMKLPLFGVADLEKGGLGVSSSAKVVDCILSLRSYYEGQQRYIPGFGAYETSGLPKEPLIQPQPVDTQGVAGFDRTDILDEPSFEVQNAQSTAMLQKSVEDVKKARSYSDSSVAWVEHICHKFVDTFMSKRENASHVLSFGFPDTKLPCEALLKLVMAVLDDKNPDEVAMLVEYMLKKVVEKFGHRSRKCVGQVFGKQNSDFQEQPVPAQGGTGSSEGINSNYALKLETQCKEVKELKYSLEAIRFQFEKAQNGWAQEMQLLDGKLHGLAQAAGQYHKVAAENRELYNQVQELKGNIRVYCRVRPFLPGENGISTVDAIVDGTSIVIVNPIRQGKEQRKAFSFNKVFGPSASQEEVFLDTQPLIRSVLDGYNVCIFAYGQTGSGKTYTMSGPMTSSYEDWGVNFRALHDLFEICRLRKNVMRYEVAVQMIEIYNEQVRDLLCMDGHHKKLEIRNSSQQNGLNVPDAKLLPVTSTDDVLELMVMGHRNRSVGATALNERSSRSHSVLTIHVKGVDLANGCMLRGCLHLVDLAGSERVDKSEATGDRLKEAQHINKSLSALGDVIAALAQKNSHVPYRNSKLTQLLQDSLGGQAKTLMFVHVSPDCDSYGESVTTLKFAERVATVELGAAQSNKENVDVKDLKNQIAFLKDALAKKDVEVEFLQEEFRLRGFDVFQERQKARNASSGATTVSRHGNGNLPVVEMHKLKVHGSAERCIENGDFPVVGRYGTMHEPDEDSLKRRASDATSPESQSSTGSVFVACPPAAQMESMAGSKKNKIRHGSFDELDSTFPGLLNGCNEVHGGSDGSSATCLKHSDGKDVSLFSLWGAPRINLSSSTRDLKTSPLRAIRPNSRGIVESGDYLTEDDDTISDYSEADSWHTATTDRDPSRASSGNQRKDAQKGFSGRQQLVKKPILPGQAMPHSLKNSLSGLSEEAKWKGGKIASEAKAFANKKPL